MKKGFTLMEVLAVILLLAVVVSLTSPVFRAVRHEIRHAQAKVAAKKLAEALKTYYQVSRGGTMSACFQATNTSITQPTQTCSNPSATGIPRSSQAATTAVEQLFACGYLSSKDFRGLPYTFCTSQADPSSPSPLTGWKSEWGIPGGTYVLAFANNESLAGEKYFEKGYIYINNSMETLEAYDEDVESSQEAEPDVEGD